MVPLVFAPLLFALQAERSPVPLGVDLYLPFPEENPLTPAKIAVGRRLFFRYAIVSRSEPRLRFVSKAEACLRRWIIYRYWRWWTQRHSKSACASNMEGRRVRAVEINQQSLMGAPRSDSSTQRFWYGTAEWECSPG
jgi:hypothetical protein